MKHCTQNKVDFIPVTDSDEHLSATFHLLRNRHISISHKSVPTYEEHAEFVKHHPYRYWLFVELDGVKIGSVYIHTDNSIGINLLEEHASKAVNILRRIIESYEPLPPVKSVRSRFFIVNVPVGDRTLADAVMEVGGVEVQRTFVFEHG